MSINIIVFTMDGCIHCKSLKQRLYSDEIDYVDVDIDLNQNLWDQVVNQTGHNVVPCVFIQKNNQEDGPIYIPGKDFDDENALIELIKKHIE